VQSLDAPEQPPPRAPQPPSVPNGDKPPAVSRPSFGDLAARFGWVVLLIALDQYSKASVFEWLGQRPQGMVRDACGHDRWRLAGEWLAFTLSWNPGMAWGIKAIPPLVLLVGRALAVLLLGWMLARAERGRMWFNASLALILAGAAGNLWDNLTQGNLFERAAGAPLKVGLVRDFIDVYFGIGSGWHFPTFNVADSCISVGAVLLIVSSLRSTPAPSASPR
jgi:lipoprotein signal peptidase